MLNETNVNVSTNYHNFTAADIRSIRQLRNSGLSLKLIAHQYKCSIALVSKIARHQIYKDIK